MVTPLPARSVQLSAAEFDGLFPFHVSYGRDGRVGDVGRSLGKLAPAVRPGVDFAAVFTPKRPDHPFSWERLTQAAGRLYTMTERTTGTILRGQFVPLADRIFFLGTPWLADTTELQQAGLTLDDFAIHDPTLDLLQVLQLQKIVTDDLELLTNRIKTQSVQIAEAARAKNIFLTSISHELRTPLTGILGMSEILTEEVHGPLNANQRNDVQIILTSGRILLKLINDVIDFSKFGAGQAQVKKITTPIESFCHPAIEQVRPQAEKRQQRLIFANEAPGVSVAVETRRMVDVLVNLLGNACKFTPEGGECGLRVTATGTEVRLEVWDHGIGIAAENIAKLFQPFVQLDGRITRRYDGTGLGLALVKQWLNLHGGRVEVQSELGKGSSFTVVLTRVAVETSPTLPVGSISA